ncbi:histone-like nucleoid-structuring protein Lsr2 [Streptomyces sp. NPDC095613]|uniref:Lsr2 family DNA-binding protein n=1 Tax=Streptomyces sp. NPDC095613 TaxID=3155540 RepID=UPI0033221E85
MTGIDELVQLCPPPRETSPTDWAAVESSLGISLPDDYKQIADIYGPGAFCGFLHLYHPQAPTEWTDLTGPMPATIRRQLQVDRARDTYSVPHDPQYLFAIGVTDNGEYLFWITEPPSRSEQWHLAVNEARGPRWYAHEGGIADFLAAVLSGREHVHLFPRDLLDRGAFFAPAAQVPQRPSQARPTGGAMSTNEIRAWAREQGYDVPDRGRIPAAVIDAYKQAQEQ